MTQPNYIYDANLSAFKNPNDNEYYRIVDGEYKLLSEINANSTDYTVHKGVVTYLSDAQRNAQNIYVQPTIENTISQIDKDIFKLSWTQFTRKYPGTDDIVKYLIVHPDRRPAGTDLVIHKNNKKDVNKVLNPFTNKKIKKGSKEYRQLLLIYDNPGGVDGTSRAMIPIPENKINWYYVNSGDDDNGKIFKKHSPNGKNTVKFANLLKTSVLHENILFVPSIKPTGTSLNLNLKHYEIEPHIEMVVDNIHAPIIRDIIYNGSKKDFVDNQATTLLISFVLKLDVQTQSNAVAASTSQKTTTHYVTTITYKHNKEAFMKQLLNDILKVQSKYQGSEQVHFILLMIKIASFNNTLAGGCNLEISGLIDMKDSSTFFKYGEGYIRYVRNVPDNNCLLIMFLERECSINKSSYKSRFPVAKDRYTMDEKNALMNSLRTKLDLGEQGQMLPLGSIHTLCKEFGFNATIQNMDGVRFECDGKPVYELSIVLEHDHYFEYIGKNHNLFDIASARAINTYEQLWENYCEKTAPKSIEDDVPVKKVFESKIGAHVPKVPTVKTEILVTKVDIAEVKSKKVETKIGPKVAVVEEKQKQMAVEEKKKQVVVAGDTRIGEKQAVPKNERSSYFWISYRPKIHTLANDHEIVFLKVSFYDNTSQPKSYCFQHGTSIFNYSDQNMDELFIDYCLDNGIKYIVTYGGATRDLFPLYHAINKHKVAKINPDNKFDLIYSNSTFYKIGFNGISTVDLQLFIKAELADVCKQMNLPYFNDPTMFVSVMRQIFTHYEHETFNTYKFSLLNFSSANAMSSDFWMSTLPSANGHTQLAKLTLDQYNIAIKAKYGAYFYPLKYYFKTKAMNVSDAMKTKDYMRKIDASGCYSYAMYKHKYPINSTYKLRDQDLIAINDALKQGKTSFKLGIYEVSYLCPKKLRRPVLPKHDDDGLLWDLIDGRGFFTSPLIEHAVKKGYVITAVYSGITWNESSTTLFNQFIETTYVHKQIYSHDPVKSNMAKQMCNSLYGKLLEAVGDLSRKLCNNIEDVVNFTKKCKPIDVIYNNDDTVQMFSKDTTANDTNIRKPYQLGVFVLDYARIYMDEISDFLDVDEVPFYSIFTDSIYITQKQFEKLEQSEYYFRPVPEKLTSYDEKKDWILNHQLGKFRDDLNGSILEANFYRPNIGRLRYVNSETQLIEEKCKYPGIPASMINFNDFDFEDKKKYDFKANASLSLDSTTTKPLLMATTKSVSSDLWKRMIFNNGEWYPFGYEL